MLRDCPASTSSSLTSDAVSREPEAAAAQSANTWLLCAGVDSNIYKSKTIFTGDSRHIYQPRPHWYKDRHKLSCIYFSNFSEAIC